MLKFLSGDPLFVHFWYGATLYHISLQAMRPKFLVLVRLAYIMAKIQVMNVKTCFALAGRISRYRFQVNTRYQRSAARLHHKYKPPPDHTAVHRDHRRGVL